MVEEIFIDDPLALEIEDEQEDARLGFANDAENVETVSVKNTKGEEMKDVKSLKNTKGDDVKAVKKAVSVKKTAKTKRAKSKKGAAKPVEKIDDLWSVTVVPSLIPVKQILALKGLKVKPLRDKRHRKIGYVGRGNGVVSLVWRQWYAELTDEKARTTMLKKAGINAALA